MKLMRKVGPLLSKMGQGGNKGAATGAKDGVHDFDDDLD